MANDTENNKSNVIADDPYSHLFQDVSKSPLNNSVDVSKFLKEGDREKIALLNSQNAEHMKADWKNFGAEFKEGFENLKIEKKINNPFTKSASDKNKITENIEASPDQNNSGSLKRTKHGLHLFATIFTGGLWLPIWIVKHYLNSRSK